MYGNPLIALWMHGIHAVYSGTVSTFGVGFGIGVGTALSGMLCAYVLVRFGTPPRVSWTWTDRELGVSVRWLQKGGPVSSVRSSEASCVYDANPVSCTSSERVSRWVSRGVQTERTDAFDETRSQASSKRRTSDTLSID